MRKTLSPWARQKRALHEALERSRVLYDELKESQAKVRELQRQAEVIVSMSL